MLRAASTATGGIIIDEFLSHHKTVVVVVVSQHKVVTLKVVEAQGVYVCQIDNMLVKLNSQHKMITMDNYHYKMNK